MYLGIPDNGAVMSRARRRDERLSGRITVEGNKNAALPLIAACLLTTEECVLTNVPRIRDVDVWLDLLRGLGAG